MCRPSPTRLAPVMLRYLDDPQHFNGLRRLGEIQLPDFPR
jgi:hypothetical protein